MGGTLGPPELGPPNEIPVTAPVLESWISQVVNYLISLQVSTCLVEIMNEKLKVIVEELGKEPFNKKYNVISFDALGSEQLLQVCTFTGMFD